jgi:guanylate kinase
MHQTSAISARAQRTRQKNLQGGVIVSFTTLAHPPAAFGPFPRTIGLVALEDGRSVLAPLLMQSPAIGMRVSPRMRLSTVTPEKLRIYDVAYEEVVGKTASLSAIPGYILALTGPSGVGKSTVSKMLIRMFSEYVTPVPILTTRGRRTGDDGEYRYVTKEAFTKLQKANELVSWTHIPSETEERWYGYRQSDIQKIWTSGKLPVVITEMHLLQGLANHYGRRSILSFGLLPPGRSKRMRLSHLLRRLRARGRETEESINARLKNAERDLEFFRERKDLFDKILVNQDVHAVVKMLQKYIPGLESQLD